MNLSPNRNDAANSFECFACFFFVVFFHLALFDFCLAFLFFGFSVVLVSHRIYYFQRSFSTRCCSSIKHLDLKYNRIEVLMWQMTIKPALFSELRLHEQCRQWDKPGSIWRSHLCCFFVIFVRFSSWISPNLFTFQLIKRYLRTQLNNKEQEVHFKWLKIIPMVQMVCKYLHTHTFIWLNGIKEIKLCIENYVITKIKHATVLDNSQYNASCNIFFVNPIIWIKMVKIDF